VNLSFFFAHSRETIPIRLPERPPITKSAEWPSFQSSRFRIRVSGQISQPVEQVDDDLRKLIDDMLDTMYAAPGIGLAAIQVGVAKRVLVIDLQEPEEEGGDPVRRPRVFINPEILQESATFKGYNEGCLSVPEMYADVDRPDSIQARWLDRDGVAHEERIDGMLAVVLQHEMDHLNGVLFIDHLSRLKREMLLKKLTKLRREQAKRAA
jgi:peptide deformylase